MADPGMKPLSPAQTIPGGVCMEPQEVTMGEATYEVRRVYRGDRPIQELVMAQMECQHLAHPTFDGDAKGAV